MRPRCTLWVRWSIRVKPGRPDGGRRRHGHEIDVVNARSAIPVDQVDEAAADAADAGDVEFHRASRVGARLGAEIERAPPGQRGVLDAKRHGAGGRPVGRRELLPEARGLGVDDEVDVALAVQRDVLAPVAGHHREAHALEQAAQQLGVRGRVLDELETVRAHRILEEFRHGRAPRAILVTIATIIATTRPGAARITA
jgi:hypothetical protein